MKTPTIKLTIRQCGNGTFMTFSNSLPNLFGSGLTIGHSFYDMIDSMKGIDLLRRKSFIYRSKESKILDKPYKITIKLHNKIKL